MTKLRMKTDFIMIMVLSLLLVGSIGNIAKNIELPEKDLYNLQEKSLKALQDSENNPVYEEIKIKVEGITGYEEHDLITINGNTNFNDTAYAEGWTGTGSIDNPFIIQGLNITGNGKDSGDYLIHILNTNVYFQITKCYLASGACGIQLENVRNGYISNNTIIPIGWGGIILGNSANNTVVNNTILDNLYGCYLYSSSINNTFVNNTILDNSYGFRLEQSNNNIISNNFVSDKYRVQSSIGFNLEESMNNTLSYNNISSSRGMRFVCSSDNEIVNNSFLNGGIYLGGSQLSDYFQTEVSNNTVNGKALIYWVNKTAKPIPNEFGQLILINSSLINVTNLDLLNSDVGLLAAYCSDLIISNNYISENENGITIAQSSYIDIFNNTLVGTYSGPGISLEDSTKIAVQDNSIVNYSTGISLHHSTYCQIYRNLVFDSYEAVNLLRSHYNTFFDNIVYRNRRYGLYIHSSHNNTFFLNSIINSTDYGVYMIYAENNILTRNNFINNAPTESSQGFCLNIEPANNTIEYNHWNDWILPDLDKDGVVDYPYPLYTLLTPIVEDLNPLTTPFHLSVPTITFPNGDEKLNDIANIQWLQIIDQWGRAVTFSVYYSADNGSSWDLIPSATNLNASIFQWDTSTVPDGTEYLIKIIALYSFGLTVEDISDSTFTIQNTVVTTTSAPHSLTTTAGRLFVYLTWTAPSSEGGSAITGYHVYRGTSSGEYTVTFATLDTNYNDTLVVGVTYYYVVTAINAIGESIFSAEVSSTPTEPAVIQLVSPGVPQSLTATAGELFVTLSWAAPSSDGGSAITSYHVYRGTSSGEYVLLSTTTSTTYNDTLVIGETPFYYIVTANNAVGESVFSNEVSATPTGATVPKSGFFPDLLSVLLFLGTAVFFTRKKNRS